MTPKEKASELMTKIFNEQHNDERAKMILLSTPKIAVHLCNEMINELSSFNQLYMSMDEYERNSRKLFWEQVKEEIQKL